MTKRETAIALWEAKVTTEQLTAELKGLTEEIEKTGSAVRRGREVLDNLRREYKTMRDEYIGLRSLMFALSAGKIGKDAAVAQEVARMHKTN